MPSGLLQVAALLSGCPPEEMESLAASLLASPRPNGGRSTLNNDGSPLQVCITLAGAGARSSVRLIADPASDTADGDTRFRRARGALDAVLASHGPAMRPLCELLCAGVLPEEAAARAELPDGRLWVAAGLAAPGLALYATVKWGAGPERWPRTRRWLAETLPRDSDAQAVLDRLAPHTVLVSAGVEGTGPENARAKLYWRLDSPFSLRDLGLPLLDTPEMADFLTQAIGEQRVSRDAVVGSVGFNAARGSLSDAKLDLCAHCVRRSPGDWARVIAGCIRRYRLAELPAGWPSLLDRTEVAFVGLGLDAALMPRLNIYLKRSPS